MPHSVVMMALTQKSFLAHYVWFRNGRSHNYNHTQFVQCHVCGILLMCMYIQYYDLTRTCVCINILAPAMLRTRSL